MADVCLVQMPYCAVARPSLALGLLKAYLTAARIDTEVVYANILFADEIGLDVYRAIEETSIESLIGEWTFASAAFPDAPDTSAAFLALVSDHFKGPLFDVLRRLHAHLDYEALLQNLRRATPSFVDRLARMILARQPRIVGCTSSFQQHCGSLALLRRIKELAPAVVTMIGGANCEGVMGQTAHREFPWLDFVMSGEVDDFIADLCARVLREGAAVGDVPDGVFARHHPPRRVAPGLTAPRSVAVSLDRAAIPDYRDYFEAVRQTPVGPHVKPLLLFESSRGCWWGMKHHCTFCGLNGAGMRFRAKSPERILHEMQLLMDRYHIRRLQAVDNIIDMKYLDAVLPALSVLAEPPHLFYEVKANLRRDQLRKLRAGGVVRIQPGIENMHDDVLALLNKGNTWFMNVQVLRWAQEFGIRAQWNFLCGAPGESDKWYAEMAGWLPLLAHLQPPGRPEMQPLRYQRFSPYHHTPEKWNLHLKPHAAYAQVYPLSPEALHDLAYSFEDAGPHARQSRRRGPGAEAINAQLRAWWDGWGGRRARPTVQLTATDAGGRTIIRDTRPVAVAPEIVLDGLPRAVLKACDTARSRDALVDAVRADGGAGASPTDVYAALEQLEAWKLALEWRGRIVSLPVNAPVTPYCDEDQGAFVDMGTALRRAAPASLARRSTRSPYDVPLTELFSS